MGVSNVLVMSRAAYRNSVRDCSWLKRQINHLVPQFFRFTRLGNHLQVENATGNRDLALMGIDDAAKGSPISLTVGGFPEQVVIPAK